MFHADEAAHTIKRMKFLSGTDQCEVALRFADLCAEATTVIFDRERFLKLCSPIGADFSKVVRRIG